MSGALSEEKKAEMRAATKAAAHALSDDLKHIREVFGKDEIRPGDLRRLSNQMRRILVESDLRKIAAPRLGRIMIAAPQLRPYHHANEKAPFTLFSGGKLKFKQMQIGDMLMSSQRVEIVAPNPDVTVELTLDQFCAQRVICFRGTWATRQDVIKYIANAAHGVHSGDASKEASYKLLDSLKNHAGIKFQDGFPTMVMNIDAMGVNPKPWVPNKDRIDFAMVQLMSTGQYLVESPMVRELENFIDSEDG
jgi:hypothetical protein